jgi:hypothetical protein
MNRELIGKAVALLVSYRDYTEDCRIANVCGEIVEALKAELAKPEHNFDTPEAHIVKWSIPVDPNNFGEPLAQPEQEWHCLTDFEIARIYTAWDKTNGVSFADFARAVEFKLRCKNDRQPDSR